MLSEAAFWQTLNVKALGSLNVYQALIEYDLDFLCYFSSGQAYAFSGAASLPAYAAGITQADSLVQALSVNAPFPVGIINWGFWQDSVKAVANAGEVGALSREAGFACFERFISQLTQQGLTQLLCLNASAAVLALMPGAEKNVKALTPTATARISPDAPSNEARFKDLVKTSLSEALKLAVDDIDNNTAFSDYGMDSVVAVGFVKRIADALSCELNTALIYDYTTVNRLTDYLLRHHHESVPTADSSSSYWSILAKARRLLGLKRHNKATLSTTGSATDIAIIGMAGQFPGASDISQFWQNLINGIDGLSLSAQQTGLAGLLTERHCFDALFFNISPREAEAMSLQQRLVLEQAWLALEDASINPKTLTDTRTGIFIGAEPSHFVGESFTGASDAIIASRLAYFLDLKGPALVVNTGCSSSAVALHLACQSLINQESELALAGGIFVGLTPDMLQTLSAIDMLSASGSCKSFDADADGTAFAEGVGIVVLKRLAQAIAEGDPIYAVIQASMMNQDGASNGMTAPNGLAQQALLTELYNTKRIQPERLSYIETHGTGTRLGDPVEANALVRTFKTFTDKTNFCALGSAKAHIGHTSAAAGVIGLIKLVLSMQNQTLPGLLHFKRLNPLVKLTDSAFYIAKHTQAWPKPLTGLRQAGLSSFGHSGTNVHIVVADYVAEKSLDCSTEFNGVGEAWVMLGGDVGSMDAAAKPSGMSSRRPRQALPMSAQDFVIVLSAKTPERLSVYAQKLLAFIDSYSGELADLAYTLQVGREAMTYRLGFCVASLSQCQSVLSDYLTGQGEGEHWSVSKAPREALLLDSTLELTTQPSLLQGLALWLKGYAIDWQVYYASEKPKRIHAPVYPFARDDYGWQSTTAPTQIEPMATTSWTELTYVWQWQVQARTLETVKTTGPVLIVAPLAEQMLLNELQQHTRGQSVTIVTELVPTELNIPDKLAAVYFFAPMLAVDDLAVEKLLLRLIHRLKTVCSAQHSLDIYVVTIDCFPLFDQKRPSQCGRVNGFSLCLSAKRLSF
ncbi:beta-ketoacyl synthase N-terminal-like domain-containing protein [Methylocucumis oryzae]|uniref:beta-ketoacyl synthase N-terminal-like domain-containing protein n=1 Tax=Methylocucumis oryzae TaxID=1632867 RepID=UPI0006991CAC|nr:beta-ketoacyl synthase N-terminal-like domain-containing protein [Methylocucumis oryzae]